MQTPKNKKGNENLLDKISAETKKDFQTTKWEGSFWQFADQIKKNPHTFTRTAYQYLNDMIEHFGKYKFEDCGEELTRYKLFDDPFDNCQHAVFGLDRILMELVSNIKTTAEKGGDERILILHGPVATAKTSIVNLLMKGLEEYSKTESGSIYTFSWLFPSEITSKVGFKLQKVEETERESYVHLPKNHMIADLQCQLNDNPLLLIPKKYRKEYLEELVKNSGIKNFNIPKKLLEGDLCYNCQNIYDYLSKKYSGNFNQTIKHVRVERFVISQINQKGAATVQPVGNTEGSSPVVTWEGKEYAYVERLLRGINLHKFVGKWADSNRGLIHFSDIFKKDSFYLQYLLSAVQEHLVDFNGVQGYVDATIIGTTNKKELKDFKAGRYSAALDDRVRKTDIIYLTQVNAEKKIYKKQLTEAGYEEEPKNVEQFKHIYPHLLEMTALWSVLTRLEEPDQTNYQNKRLTTEKVTTILDLTPLQKAKLYNGETPPYLESEDKKILKDKYVQKIIRREHPLEGGRGVSPRILQNMLTDILAEENKKAVEDQKCLNIFRVFNGIEKILEEGEEKYNFLKEKETRKGYQNFKVALRTVFIEYHNTIIKEAKWAIIGIKRELVETKVKEYIEHVKAYNKKEKVKNSLTGRDEQPSEDKMKWVEEKLKIKDSEKKEFRKEVIREAAYARIESGNEELDYKNIYSDLYQQIEDGLFEEKKEQLPLSFEQLQHALSKFGTEKFQKLDKQHKESAEEIIQNMINNYSYCENCAKDVTNYVIEKNLFNNSRTKEDLSKEEREKFGEIISKAYKGGRRR